LPPKQERKKGRFGVWCKPTCIFSGIQFTKNKKGIFFPFSVPSLNHASPLQSCLLPPSSCHACLYARACQLETRTSSMVPWNGRGRRLVEMTRGVLSQTLKPVVKFNLFPYLDMLIFHRTISLQTTLVPRHSAIPILSSLGTQGHRRCRLDRIKINIRRDIQIGCQPISDVKREIRPGIKIGCDMKIRRQTRRDIQIRREFRRQVNVGRDSNIGREMNIWRVIGHETQIRRVLGRAIQIGREIETVYTCLWGGLHPQVD